MTNYAAWDIESLASANPSKEDLFLNLAGWAILAPNTHNVQPWRFILDLPKNIIHICLDPQGILPASDSKARQAHISIGCAAENLLKAAESYGLKYHAEYPCEQYPLATVRIYFDEPEKILQQNLRFFNAMKARAMNRGKFDLTKPIPPDIIEKIEKYLSELHLALDAVCVVSTRFQIAELQYSADRAVIARANFRKELAQFILPNNTDAARGMPGKTFGLSDEMAAYVHEALKKEGVFDADLAVGFAASSRDGIRNAPCLLVISVPHDTPSWWIKAGRALEYIALLLTMHGFSTSVYAGLIEVEMFNASLKKILGRPERPTVLLRIGRASGQMPHSPRISIKKIAEIIR